MNRMERMLKSHMKDNNISGSVFDDYFKKVSRIQNNNTPYLLESNGMSVDIFSKLLEDRIIFLSTDVDDYVCNIIKAQLIYLVTESDKDIKNSIESFFTAFSQKLNITQLFIKSSPKM